MILSSTVARAKVEAINPDITVVRIDYGTFPLDIRWDDPDPAFAVARCEKVLLAFSPSFKRHECRGPEVYHGPRSPSTVPWPWRT